MAKTGIALLVLALVLTGVVTATAFAEPIVTGPKGDTDMDTTRDRLQTGDCDCIGDRNMTQTRNRAQLRACSGDMLQTRERLQLKDHSGCANCTGNGVNRQGPNQSQNRICKQTCGSNN
jgi:hypothetical protein